VTEILSLGSTTIRNRGFRNEFMVRFKGSRMKNPEVKLDHELEKLTGLTLVELKEVYEVTQESGGLRFIYEIVFKY